MKSWRLALPALLALAASGCTVGQHHVEVAALQNENRNLEDNLYQQQAAMKDLCQQLDACRADNATLRHRLQESSPSGSQTAPNQRTAQGDLHPPSVKLPEGMPGLTPPDSSGAGGLPQAPEEESPRATEATPYHHTPPATDAPPSPYPPPSTTPAKPLRGDSNPSASDAPRAVDPAPQFGHAVRGDNTKVAAITLHPIVTGGHHADETPGGDGIALWIEPRDQAGNLVRAAAPVAVVVLDPDPSMAGQSARVARWDFASEATAAFYRKTATAEGIFLELPWPGDPPKHRALEVFVRYATDDGRKIEARRPIHLDLANQPEAESHAGWSRRASPAPTATTAYPSEKSPSGRAKESSAVSDASPSQHPAAVSPAGDEPAEKSKLQRPAWSPDRP